MSIVSFVVSFAMRLNWSIVSCVVSFTMRLNCSKNSNQSFNVNPAIYVCNNWSDVVQCHILKYTSHYSLGKQTGQWSEKGVLIRHMTSHMTSIKPNDVIKFTSPLNEVNKVLSILFLLACLNNQSCNVQENAQISICSTIRCIFFNLFRPIKK